MKLNQVVSIEKSTKSRTQSELSKLHHQSQKSDLYNGLLKSYIPKDEDGELLPNEEKRVQNIVQDDLIRLQEIMSELLDITAIKDYGNCVAFADLIVDGVKVLEKVPSTYLIFLEKQMILIKTFIDKLPELDPSDEWVLDNNVNLFKTKPYETHRTKKTSRPIVLYGATDKHAAQTQLITEDILVGYWRQVKSSGAMKSNDKRKMLKNVDQLSDAIKSARAQANCCNVEEIKVGNKLFNYIFN